MLEVPAVVTHGWRWDYGRRAEALAAEHAPQVADVLALADELAEAQAEAQGTEALVVEGLSDEALAAAVEGELRRRAAVRRLEQAVERLGFDAEALNASLCGCAIDALTLERAESGRAIDEHEQALLMAEEPGEVEALRVKLELLRERADFAARTDLGKNIREGAAPPLHGETAVAWRSLVGGAQRAYEALAEARAAARPTPAELRAIIVEMAPEERTALFTDDDLRAAVKARGWDASRLGPPPANVSDRGR